MTKGTAHACLTLALWQFVRLLVILLTALDVQTVAEKAAWELAKKEGIDLVTIHPAFVIGKPRLVKRKVLVISISTCKM